MSPIPERRLLTDKHSKESCFCKIVTKNIFGAKKSMIWGDLKGRRRLMLRHRPLSDRFKTGPCRQRTQNLVKPVIQYQLRYMDLKSFKEKRYFFKI
jgi:hypothetical protein